MRVIEARDDGSFSEESRETVVRQAPAVQDLQRHASQKAHVFCQVHRPLSAATQFGEDPIVGDRVVNRTATFVFLLGDRFYGTVTAFVQGERAAGYTFTSALAVQILKDLAPQLMPLVESEGPPASALAQTQSRSR